MFISKSELFQRLPAPSWSPEDQQELKRRLCDSQSKIIVLDDDPTGTQTVHGVPVYTDWGLPQIEALFAEPSQLCFILTNTRALIAEAATKANQEIAERVCQVSKQTGVPFCIIHRGDSTLRGHYPLEGEVVRSVLESQLGPLDGEIIVPCFFEGGRYTWQDTHYVEVAGQLVPAATTEFAKDNTFGYHSSNLTDWVEEKTAGLIKAEAVGSISLGLLRSEGANGVAKMLSQVAGFRRIVVNAVDYSDLLVFTLGLLRAEALGKRFLIRSAASFVKVRGGIGDQPLLDRPQLTSPNGHGGLVIVGSHVDKTNRQLQAAFKLPNLIPIVLEVSRVVDQGWAAERDRVAPLIESALSQGHTTLLYTTREVLRSTNKTSEANLKMSAKVSQALVGIVQSLRLEPSFLVTKGGITSSDIATKGLGIKRAVAGGQVRPGIPVWFTGTDCKFPRLPLIIFPGNVGTDDTLREIISQLANQPEDA